MKAIYFGKFRFTPMIISQIKFETLVWRLIKDLAQNLLWARVEVEQIPNVSCEGDSKLATAIT